MVEVMITNQDIIKHIASLTLLINLLNLKKILIHIASYFIHLFRYNLYSPVHCYCMYFPLGSSPNGRGAEIIEVN